MRSKRMKHLRWVVISGLFITLVMGSLWATSGTAGNPQGGWFLHGDKDTDQCISTNGGDFLVKNDGPDTVFVSFIDLENGEKTRLKVPVKKGNSTLVHAVEGWVFVMLKDKSECKTSNGTFTIL